MTSNDPIGLDYETVGSLKRQLTDLSLALGNSMAPLRTARADVIEGAGQVADQLATDVAGFELAWGVSLDVLSKGAALVGNNIGSAMLDFSAMDVAYSSDIRL